MARPGKHNRKRQRGLTLLEVLIAVMILGLVLTGVGMSTAQNMRSAESTRVRTYANWIAQNRIAEFRLANEIPEVGNSSGEVTYAGFDWAWTANVSETGVENLLRIDVDVSFPEDDNALWTVTGFVGEPSIPGQANRAWNANVRRRGEEQ